MHKSEFQSRNSLFIFYIVSMILIRTNSSDKDFINLVKLLDIYLNPYKTVSLQKYNSIETIKYVVVAYNNFKQPIGCGAIRQYDQQTMEIKRMFVVESERGNNIATGILKELEDWTLELGFKRNILETGRDMPRAIAFYTKWGYELIDNYEPYIDNEKSICFEKKYQ